MENRESEYYLGNRNNLPIIVSVKISGIIYSEELPWDATGVDVLHAIYAGLCLHNTKNHKIFNALDEFAAYTKNIEDDIDSKYMDELIWKIEYIKIKTSNKIVHLKFESSVVTTKTLLIAIQSSLIGLGYETESSYACFSSFVHINRFYDEDPSDCDDDIDFEELNSDDEDINDECCECNEKSDCN